MPVVAVSNLKGGTGKTTTVLNVAGFAGASGKRVLAVDVDPQASLTRVILAGDEYPETTIAQAFAEERKSLDGVILPSTLENVDLVPANLSFGPVLDAMLSTVGREFILADMLEPHLKEYDLILLDCRPSLDLSVVNAMTASSYVLVPVETSYMALDGYDHVRQLYDQLRRRMNPTLAFLGLLPTKHRKNIAHSEAALKEIETRAEEDRLPLRFEPIRMSTAATEAPARSSSLATFAPRSPVGVDYNNATRLILEFFEGRP